LSNRIKPIAREHPHFVELFLRERVDDNTISLSHVPSADNIADLLTKGLPRESFDRLRDLLGVTPRSISSPGHVTACAPRRPQIFNMSDCIEHTTSGSKAPGQTFPKPDGVLYYSQIKGVP